MAPIFSILIISKKNFQILTQDGKPGVYNIFLNSRSPRSLSTVFGQNIKLKFLRRLDKSIVCLSVPLPPIFIIFIIFFFNKFCLNSSISFLLNLFNLVVPTICDPGVFEITFNFELDKLVKFINLFFTTPSIPGCPE